jgi:hypothetical protein
MSGAWPSKILIDFSKEKSFVWAFMRLVWAKARDAKLLLVKLSSTKKQGYQNRNPFTISSVILPYVAVTM